VEQTSPRFFDYLGGCSKSGRLTLDKIRFLWYNVIGTKDKTAAEYAEEAENDRVS